MFSGFSEQTGDFLWGLALNNDRSWFAAHREEYTQYLLAPFTALSNDVFAIVDARHPKDGFALHIARIYRDARRLHGGGPYKDHLWFSVKNTDGLLCGPTFWFEIGRENFSYGMGFYSATPAQMELFRKTVAANPARFERLVTAVDALDKYQVEGEEYKKSKGDLGPIINRWYSRKRLGLCHTEPFGPALFDPSLPTTIADAFEELLPMYYYFMKLVEA